MLGPMFLKAIDGSGEYKDKYYIANLILITTDEVGPQNVVQLIMRLTDNASVCKVVDSIVESIHPHIFWTMHTLNLALKHLCPKNTPNNDAIYGECHWIFGSKI